MKKNTISHRVQKNQKGMTLVELIIYMSMLVLLLGAIIQSVLMLSTHYRAVRNTRDLEDSGINVMDRIVREARSATDVLPIAGGSFATTTFITTDSVTGLSTTTSFYVVSNKLHISENGVDLGPLTKESVRVIGFDVKLIQNSNSKAIKIDVSLLSDEATPAIIAKNFYNTVVIRGSYQ
jgi:type II secretory pathway pseudopilin PulG